MCVSRVVYISKVNNKYTAECVSPKAAAAHRIIIRALYDDYPTVCGRNTRNKRAAT